MARHKGPRQQRAEAGGVVGMLERAQQQMPISEDGLDGVDEVFSLPSETDEEPETWEAELPPPTSEDLAAALARSVTVREVTDADLDNLWDWIRRDEDRGEKFMGIRAQTSQEMRDRCLGFGADFYAIQESSETGEAHVGFVGVGVAPDQSFAMVRLYLASAARGRIQGIAPQLMREAQARYPSVPAFTVLTEDEATARLYRGLGFTHLHLLKWTVPVPVTGYTEHNDG